MFQEPGTREKEYSPGLLSWSATETPGLDALAPFFLSKQYLLARCATQPQRNMQFITIPTAGEMACQKNFQNHQEMASKQVNSKNIPNI